MSYPPPPGIPQPPPAPPAPPAPAYNQPPHEWQPQPYAQPPPYGQPQYGQPPMQNGYTMVLPPPPVNAPVRWWGRQGLLMKIVMWPIAIIILLFATAADVETSGEVGVPARRDDWWHSKPWWGRVLIFLGMLLVVVVAVAIMVAVPAKK